MSKLKDHVNVSIMKAVQVDESKDTNTMCIVIIEEIYRQFKSDCCGRSPILLLNGEWDIFFQYLVVSQYSFLH
jgi:hypothetical protein